LNSLSLCFSPDSKVIAEVTLERGIRIWDINSGDLMWQSEPWIADNHISFQGNALGSTRLLTYGGAFTILDADNRASSTGPARQASIVKRSGYGLSSDGRWILWNEDKVLWVPTQFRSMRKGIIGSSVILGTVSERLCFITLSYGSLLARNKRATSPPDSPGRRAPKSKRLA
jgi:WD40 repeat protein